MAFKTAAGEPILGLGLIAKVLGALISAVVIRFFIKLYQVRSGIRRRAREYDIVSEALHTRARGRLSRESIPKPHLERFHLALAFTAALELQVYCAG